MTGNDDMGTMSAWHVLSAIGIFPVQPGYDTWGLSTPVFDRIDLTLDPRYHPLGALTVTAPGTSDSRRHVQSVAVDGVSYSRTYVTSALLRGARALEFTVGPEPSGWGTGVDAAPPALK